MDHLRLEEQNFDVIDNDEESEDENTLMFHDFELRPRAMAET